MQGGSKSQPISANICVFPVFVLGLSHTGQRESTLRPPLTHPRQRVPRDVWSRAGTLCPAWAPHQANTKPEAWALAGKTQTGEGDPVLVDLCSYFKLCTGGRLNQSLKSGRFVA